MVSPKLSKPQSTTSAAAPALAPPADRDGGVALLEEEPVALTQSEIEAMTNAVRAAAPTLAPPAAEGVGAEAEASVWVNAKKVNALWSINQNRNSWASFADVGFRKFADNSDSAIVAFTILAAHAKQVQSDTNRREESDGRVHELYVW